MVRLTLAQMRRSIGRLSAAGIAILIGTAFLTATLLAGNVITRITTDSIAAQFADSDLVVSSDQGIDEAGLESIRATAGVDAADPQIMRAFELTSGGKHSYQVVIPSVTDPRFEAQEVVEGAMPTRSGEVALPGDVAERFGLAVGDTVTLVRSVWTPAAGALSRCPQLTGSSRTSP
ncbi:ABC transporter permease [Oerskovia sp. M15]